MTERISSYDPETGICWQFRNKGDRKLRCRCPACSGRYGERTPAFFGRCRSGIRWFWLAYTYDLEREAFGWADTEELATQAAMAAVRSFHNGLPMIARFWQHVASEKLKELNEAKRAARSPSDAKDPNVIEYLYSDGHCDGNYCDCHKLTGQARWEYHMKKFQIIKKTEQRIYYNRRPLPFVKGPESGVRDLTDYGTAYINRQKIEQDEEIWTHKRGGWWEADSQLYFRPPRPPDHWCGG
jgi:hypothetical protein